MSGFSGNGQEKKTLSEGGRLVNPLIELTQPGGPYPSGYTLITDGYGGYAIVQQPDVFSFTADYNGRPPVLNAVCICEDGRVSVADAAAPTVNVIGFVTSVDTPVIGKCQVKVGGIVGGFTKLKPGFSYFLSADPGKVSIVPAPGRQILCGVALSETLLLIKQGA